MFIFMRPADDLSISMVIEKVKSLPASVKEYYQNRDSKEMPGEQGVEHNKIQCLHMHEGR